MTVNPDVVRVLDGILGGMELMAGVAPVVDQDPVFPGTPDYQAFASVQVFNHANNFPAGRNPFLHDVFARQH